MSFKGPADIDGWKEIVRVTDDGAGATGMVDSSATVATLDSASGTVPPAPINMVADSHVSEDTHAVLSATEQRASPETAANASPETTQADSSIHRTLGRAGALVVMDTAKRLVAECTHSPEDLGFASESDLVNLLTAPYEAQAAAWTDSDGNYTIPGAQIEMHLSRQLEGLVAIREIAALQLQDLQQTHVVPGRLQEVIPPTRIHVVMFTLRNNAFVRILVDGLIPSIDKVRTEMQRAITML